jgi:cephalosporin-C deacetylase-like acetyl esterase
MGLVLTGLNKNITAACVNIPALCDHLGFRAGRAAGWPQVLGWRARRKMTKEQIETAAEMLPYFDAVNFSRKIAVPVLLTMGFLDITCPPSGVYAAYNVIQSPKRIVTNPQYGHRPAGREIVEPWVRRQLGLEGSP